MCRFWRGIRIGLGMWLGARILVALMMCWLRVLRINRLCSGGIKEEKKENGVNLNKLVRTKALDLFGGHRGTSLVP